MFKSTIRAALTVAVVLAGLILPASQIAAARTAPADQAHLPPGSSAVNSVPDSTNPLSIRASVATSSTLYLPVVIKNGPHWVTIFSDDFEGAFPGGNWTRHNYSPGIGDYQWAVSTCAALSGTHSAWPIGGGAIGSTLTCGANYPDNANIWMWTGPFSLADATDADFSFDIDSNTEGAPSQTVFNDGTCGRVSTDNVNFLGYCVAGSSQGAWIHIPLNLGPTGPIGSWLGKPMVWIGFNFFSNGSIHFPNGAFIDNVLFQKCVGGTCSAPANSATAAATRPAGLTVTARRENAVVRSTMAEPAPERSCRILVCLDRR